MDVHAGKAADVLEWSRLAKMMTQDVMTQKVQASNVTQSFLQHAAVAASHSSNFVEFS